MKTETSTRPSLEQLIQKAGSPVKLLRSSPLGPYIFPAIPAEFTNWRDEQRAWKEGVSLLEQSYHMTEVHLRGRQARAFLASLCVNKFDPFPAMRAKQLVMASHDGYYLADAILFHEEDEYFRIVGGPMAGDWAQFNFEQGGYDIELTVDESYASRSGPRDVFRFQLQGPNALPLLREITDGVLPDIGFFHIGEISIAGRPVRALRHGMAGEPGFEIYGRWDDQGHVRASVERAGEKYGLRKGGALAYATPGIESGWMPVPLPAIYHSAEMKPYREWLDTSNMETIGSLGGSFYSDDITDYYVNPFEIGYGRIIDFNHEFIGRDALAKLANANNRKKVTLKWNEDDVVAINRAALFPGQTRAKYIETPSPIYSTFQADSVMKGDKLVGISQWSCYTTNTQAYISLATIDAEHCEIGTELTLLWGEQNPTRPAVEKHEIRPIRVTVAPVPYFEKVIKSANPAQN